MEAADLGIRDKTSPSMTSPASAMHASITSAPSHIDFKADRHRLPTYAAPGRIAAALQGSILVFRSSPSIRGRPGAPNIRRWQNRRYANRRTRSAGGFLEPLVRQYVEVASKWPPVREWTWIAKCRQASAIAGMLCSDCFGGECPPCTEAGASLPGIITDRNNRMVRVADNGRSRAEPRWPMTARRWGAVISSIDGSMAHRRTSTCESSASHDNRHLLSTTTSPQLLRGRRADDAARLVTFSHRGAGIDDSDVHGRGRAARHRPACPRGRTSGHAAASPADLVAVAFDEAIRDAAAADAAATSSDGHAGAKPKP